MADPETPNAEVEPVVPQTTEAAPAPGSEGGQAGGSPSPKTDPTSGGSDEKPDDAKELRRKVTKQAEELKIAQEILDAAMRTPEWKAVDARLRGQPAPVEDDTTLRAMFEAADADGGVAAAKKWERAVIDKAKKELLAEMRPLVAEVGATKQEKDIVRALKAEGLAPTEDFEVFKEDFEAENPSYAKVRSVDPAAAARWLASSYSVKVKKDGRTPVGKGADSTLERGSGTSARTGAAASLVKIARNDPDMIHKLHAAIKKGETAVDENGQPYPVRR